jgi:methyl-accepting chemotaxis protein-1 (serine sensor receptor)
MARIQGRPLKIKDLRVKTKLMLGFSLLAILVMLVSTAALVALTRTNTRFTDHLATTIHRTDLATDIRGVATRRAIAARNLVLVTEAADREAEKMAVLAAHDQMKVMVGRLADALKTAPDATPRHRALLAEIQQVEARYGPIAEAIVGLALAGKHDDAVRRMNVECRPLLVALLQATSDYIAYEHSQAEAGARAAEAAFGLDRAVQIAICLLAVGTALAMGWLLSRAVTEPLSRAVRVAETVAAGDLGSRIVVDRQDEPGQLLAALKRMNDNLSGMVGRVRLAADGIATASSEIATGNQDLSNRTEQQASALQETAASMQQMTSTVQQNADSSRQASRLAQATADVAGRGGQVVARVVATMEEISASSHRMSDIIGTIDGIAFQTNILALNAAVEAARAGEQGRGFAVVAGEVRALAQRSAQAAKEIKGLIAASAEKVSAGSALVGEAGTTMGEIVTQVRRMTDLIGQVNASTDEQSSGIGQVNQAIASIDQGTQQNAALVEQSAAAAESLRQQSADLLSLVSQFRTGTAQAA